MISVAKADTGVPKCVEAQATSISALIKSAGAAAIGNCTAAAHHATSEAQNARNASGRRLYTRRNQLRVALASGTTSMTPATEFKVQPTLARSIAGVIAGKTPAASVSIGR